MSNSLRNILQSLDIPQDKIHIPDATSTKDVRLAMGSTETEKIQAIVKEKKRVLGRTGSYEYSGHRRFISQGRGRGGFVRPIYDLAEISRAMDVEPYIAQSVKKHKETILKEGYGVKGMEPEMADYVQKRLFDFFLVTDITTEQWLSEVIHNLVTYHTAFIIVRRSREHAAGRRIKRHGKVLDPIAGIFVADPTTMEVAVDKYGTIKRYRQNIRGSGLLTNGTGIKDFPPEDVIMITVDKKSGYSFGTPYILPVLDDIRALRQLEEIAAILAAKEAFPVYHVKVGTEKSPARVLEGFNEVDLADSQMAQLPEQGYVATTERVEIKVVSSEGSSIDLKPYLEYFEQRVLAGLRLSPLDLGRSGTSNRGTATNISKNVQEAAKEYQRAIIDQISHKLFIPILLEGSFNVDHTNLVKLNFPMIDREELRAHQNHGLQLYMNNGITQQEFRKDYLDKDPLTEQEKAEDTAQALQLKHELKVIAATPRPTSSSGSDLFKPSGAVATKARPENQHGTLPTKSRFTKNDYTSAVVQEFETFLDNVSSYDNIAEIRSDLGEAISRAKDLSFSEVNNQIEKGWQKAYSQYKDENITDIGKRALDNFLNNYIAKSYWIRTNDYILAIDGALKKDIDGHSSNYKIPEIVRKMIKEVETLTQEHLDTAFRFGYASYVKRIGCDQIMVENKSTGIQRIIDLSPLSYKNLMPAEEGIGCTIKSNLK